MLFGGLRRDVYHLHRHPRRDGSRSRTEWVAAVDDIENYGAFSSDGSCWAIYHGTIRAVARKPESGGGV